MKKHLVSKGALTHWWKRLPYPVFAGNVDEQGFAFTGANFGGLFGQILTSAKARFERVDQGTKLDVSVGYGREQEHRFLSMGIVACVIPIFLFALPALTEIEYEFAHFVEVFIVIGIELLWLSVMYAMIQSYPDRDAHRLRDDLEKILMCPLETFDDDAGEN